MISLTKKANFIFLNNFKLFNGMYPKLNTSNGLN